MHGQLGHSIGDGFNIYHCQVDLGAISYEQRGLDKPVRALCYARQSVT